MNQAKYLISFANKEYKDAQRNLSKSANRFNFFDHIIEYGEMDISSLVEDHQVIMQERRGFGLWLWKPYLVQKTLRTMNCGDILFYCDAGVEFINDPEILVNLTKSSDIVIFELDFVEKFWSHANLIAHFNCEAIANSYMRSASYFVIRKTDKSEKFVADWFTLCSRSDLLKDDFTSQQINNFKFHRHDQSIFSCLSKCKEFSYDAYRDPSQFGLKYIHAYTNSNFPQIFNHHRKGPNWFKAVFDKKIVPNVRKVMKI